MIKWTSWNIICCVLFSMVIGNSQSRSQLEKERNKIIEQIEQTSSELDKITSKSKSTLKDLSTIEKQIRNREKLRKNIQDQLASADASIKNNNEKKKELDADLIKMKVQFSSLLRGNYLKKLSSNKWAYLFSSNSVNEAFLRWRYSKQYESYINQKTRLFRDTRENIELATQSINEERTYVKQLLEEEKKALKKLEEDQKAKDRILASLEENKEDLTKALKDQKKKRAKLNNEIEKIILAELSKTNEVTTSSASFGKRKLPWPIKGKIIKKFGTQRHPSLKNVTINNNGIDILSSSNGTVSAVADGKVISVSNIPGYENMIIIQHGEFYSVYSKVNVAIVSKDDFVKSGQTIGRLSGAIEPELHFELWKGKEKLDPEQWIK